MRYIVSGTRTDGSTIEGTLEAESEHHAVERLQRRGIRVVKIALATAPAPGAAAPRPAAVTPAPPPTPPSNPVPPPQAARQPHQPPSTLTATVAKTDMVFVSHSSQDKESANEIVRALETAGIRCWIAPRDIPAGSDWNHHIMTALHECRVLLLLYSQHSVDSEPVKREVERAVSRSVRVVPVRLERTPPSPSLEFLISTFQWIDAFPPPLYRHIPTIVGGVQRALGAPEDAPVPSAPGELKYIGKFRIIEQLGEGGMGTVYKAEQREPVKRIVALKIVKAGFDTAEVIARFASERQALARMNHPNIARVLDAGTTELGRPYFVMEYIPGTPITQFADTHKLSIRKRLEMFLQLCDAIAHAHSKSILHRDIKAGNVLALMQEDKPVIKVIDFGIAKALVGEKLTDHTVNTGHGMVVGTYANMSPEQAEGSADLDTRSDVYSLGVLLYELLTGAKPFDPDTLKNASEAEARRIICEVEPPKPSTQMTRLGKEAEHAALVRQSRADALRRDLSGELGWIPLMAMRKERQRRYASPLLLAEDIENYLHARPLMAGPESRVYKMRKFIRRNRAILATVTVILLSIGIGAALYIRDITRADRQTRLALAEATKEQHIAQTINDFLTSLIASANPKKGNTMTMPEAIAAFTSGLDAGQLKDQPEVEASVRDTIGDLYRSLGDYDDADVNLSQALLLYRKSLAGAPDDARVAKVLDHQGHVVKDRLKHDPLTKEESQKKFAQAIQLYQTALDIERRTLPPDDLAIADTLANRGSLLMSYNPAQNLAAAEADCREAIRIREKNVEQNKLAPDSEEILQSKGELVTILSAEHNFTDAKLQGQEAISLAERSGGNVKPAAARAHLEFGDVYEAEAAQFQKEKNLKGAEADLRSALVQYTKALQIDQTALAAHPNHPYILTDQDRIDDCTKKLNLVVAAEKNPPAGDALGSNTPK